jgi:hypothetical protein
MSVSSHEENEEEGDSEAVTAFDLQRKRTLEKLEPGEKKAVKKSIEIARRW